MTDGPSEDMPPRLARWILLALTPHHLRGTVDGDLREAYLLQRQTRGRWRAELWCWRQLFTLDVLRLLVNQRSPHKRPTRLSDIFVTTWHDLKFGARALTRQPIFTGAVLITLALGIGATTAIFTLVNSVLLRPLPYDHANELVMVFRTVPRFGFTRSPASLPDFHDWRDQASSFTEMAAYGYLPATYVGERDAVQWQGYRSTANLFPLLRVTPLLGRSFDAADDLPSANPVVILSHGLWQEQFGADSTIVGRTITLDGKTTTVTGVMRETFSFPSSSTQFWVPLRGDPVEMERNSSFLTVIARLRTGVTVADAQAEMTSITERIDAIMPDGNRGYGVFVEGRQEFVVRGARTALLVFMGAVTFVLLVALTNVVNLMLARSTTRSREIAVRTALGAGRGRIVRQLLTESTLLAAIGGVLGLLTANILTRGLLAVGGRQLPRVDEIHIDSTVLVFVTLISIATGIACGTLPALVASHADPQTSLKNMHPVGLGRMGRRIQAGLVVGEVAVAMVLAVGAGLLLNSFARLTAVNPGFQPENLVAGRVAAPRPALDRSTDAQTRAQAIESQYLFYHGILENTAAQVGVTTVALSYGMPLGGFTFSRVVQPEGFNYEPGKEPVVNGNVVAGNYFETLGIPIIAGRSFTPEDRTNGSGVVVINETLARTFWPGENALGKRLGIGNGDGPPSTVVGIVPDIVSDRLSDDPKPMYYRPYVQAPWPESMYVVVRSSAPSSDVIRVVRDAMRAQNPTIPLTDITTASQLIAESVAEPRFRTLVLSVFGAIAAVLAMVGIYSVIAFTVEDRTREIGIRMALGADRRGVLTLVLIRGILLAAAGIMLGVLAAGALTRLLAGMLYGVTPYDPVTYGVCTLVLVGLSIAACYGPARKAAASDPMTILRLQ